MLVEPTPPRGTTVRPATLDDAGAIAELFNTCTLAEVGVPWTDEADMHEALSAPGVDLDNDAALAFEGPRLIAAMLLYLDGDPVADVFALGLVHPDANGRGLGTFVTTLGESRARVVMDRSPATGRFTVHGSRFLQNGDAERLFEDLGYDRVRTWWRMSLELERGVRAVPMPEGLELRPFELERDARRVYEAMREAFLDHWGEMSQPYDRWLHFMSGLGGGSGFVLMALDGEEVAGVLVAETRGSDDPESGTVGELGVRRRWRGRGLGLALLGHAFDEFRSRGLRRARLSVDSASPTGATRLYERAGMRVELGWDRWEKELRPA
jgi:GNAT superfamily N-acetyltransferase